MQIRFPPLEPSGKLPLRSAVADHDAVAHARLQPLEPNRLRRRLIPGRAKDICLHICKRITAEGPPEGGGRPASPRAASRSGGGVTARPGYRGLVSIADKTVYNRKVHRWQFLTNYTHVLLAVAENPAARLHDIAARVGITDRAAHRILTDLARAGYVTRTRRGRRVVYALHPERPLRHPSQEHRSVGVLLAVLSSSDPSVWTDTAHRHEGREHDDTVAASADPGRR